MKSVSVDETRAVGVLRSVHFPEFEGEFLSATYRLVMEGRKEGRKEEHATGKLAPL
jgi:hypothetical protein